MISTTLICRLLSYTPKIKFLGPRALLTNKTSNHHATSSHTPKESHNQTTSNY